MTDDMREMIKFIRDKYPNPKHINFRNYSQVRAVYLSMKERERKTEQEKEQERLRKLAEKEEKKQVPGQLSFIF